MRAAPNGNKSDLTVRRVVRMRSFKHITPASRIFYGPDSLESLPKELDRTGCKRVLIFCDPFLVKEELLLGRVKEKTGKRLAGVFSGILPGSPVPEVEKGAEEIRRLQADAVVVIGGGSSAVTARAAIILAAENADPHDICTTRDSKGRLQSPRLLKEKIPMFVIPTTPITAMVKAGASILDPETNTLLALFDPKTRGKAIFIHPDFVKTMPFSLLMSACMSTLAAAIDGLLSTDGEIMSDALLIHSVRIMAKHLADPSSLSDAGVKCELMLATVLCGMGSDYTGFGISVVLGHAVTAHYRVNAGFVNGIMIPHTLRYNRGADGMKKIAVAFGITEDDKMEQKIYDAAETLLGGLDIPHKLRDLDMPHDKFDEIARSAMDDWYLHYNPRPVGTGDVKDILEAAW